MGQCSTLPTESRTASSKYGERSAYRTEKYENASQVGRSSIHSSQGCNEQQSRNPDVEAMDEDYSRENVPHIPDIAIRTRCYKLNLDAELYPSNVAFLGPFRDVPPPLTFSASEDSSTDTTQTEVAVQTAAIFRGISVGKDGTILAQNARATRSNKHVKNKKGEKSRQASKIEKAKDLVEESLLTGKAPDSDEPAHMISLVVMGEYDDMKYLVRDGAKKLRDAAEFPDASLLSATRSRNNQSMRSPRKRVSLSRTGSQQSPALQTSNQGRPVGLPQSTPQKLKYTSRDSSNMENPATPLHGGNSGRSQYMPTKAIDGDFFRGFNSIWNCGGARGDDFKPSSPSHSKGNSSHPGQHGASHSSYRNTFEGRDSSFSQSRENGVAARAN